MPRLYFSDFNFSRMLSHPTAAVTRDE